MSFSASTCLSYTGTTTLTEPISIYTFSNVFITAVTLNQITSCPLVLTGIPDGTTTIKIKSANFYCCDVPLTCNDLCTTCDLDFDLYQTSLISRIVAGNLTGSCQPSISDYKINWYKDGNPTPVFTSGFGTQFTPYNYTHPLSGTSSPLAYSGTYIPVVDRVKINGLNYSQTGGTGFIQANLDCFNSSPIEVEPFDCSNGGGTSNLSGYTHRVEFSGASVGVSPLPLTATFNLDLTTNYFAWKFKAASITDSLKLSFSGSSYSNPIILEYWRVGTNGNSTSAQLTTFPKSANTNDYLNKVTSLTELTRNYNDFLILEVIPNKSNTQTTWDFYFTCLDTFNCSGCTDNYLNTPYKIKKSTVSVGLPDSCGKRTISYKLSGCTENEINNSDIGKYMFTNASSNVITRQIDIISDNITSLKTKSEVYYTGSTSCGKVGQGGSYVCKQPSNTNIIGFKKSIFAGTGLIEMTFSDLSDLAAYKTSYDNRKLTSGWQNDPTDLDYYKYAVLAIPNATGSTPCGDTVGTLSYGIHFSSVMTTGGTAPNYTLTMTMPTITNSMAPFGSCDVGCNTAPQEIVTAVNLESTGTSNNTGGYLTSNTGSRYELPFSGYWFVSYNSQPPKYSATTSPGSLVINNSLNSTVPFSGNSAPYVQIPSLSSQTCDFSSVGELFSPGTQAQARYIYVHDYKLVILNPPDLTAFSIKANTIFNGARTSLDYPVTALTYSGGTVTYSDPLYTY